MTSALWVLQRKSLLRPSSTSVHSLTPFPNSLSLKSFQRSLMQWHWIMFHEGVASICCHYNGSISVWKVHSLLQSPSRAVWIHFQLCTAMYAGPFSAWFRGRIVIYNFQIGISAQGTVLPAIHPTSLSNIYLRCDTAFCVALPSQA